MSDRDVSGGAIAWITFAGFVMVIGGGFKMLQGLAWVINSDRFPGEDLLIEQNAQTWGWWTLLLGLVVLLAGIAVFSGNVLARTVGVIGAVLSALTQFATLNFHPVWGVCVIAIDIAIIWALTAHGRDIQKAQAMGGGV